MIPKVIHYCWFGGKPLPKLAKKCIESWKKFVPEYEIKEWNESNFDVNIIPFTAAAYADRKYAFVSDYARFWILYRYGGVYLDTDVEVLKPIDDIINKGPFMGIEVAVRLADRKYGVAPGLGIACEAGHSFYKELLDAYECKIKYGDRNEEGRILSVVDIITAMLQPYGWKDEDVFQECAEILLYPSEYFCPLIVTDRNVYVSVRENTRTIHHYAASWLPKSYRYKDRIARMLGPELVKLILKIKKCFRKLK